jgi:hypothetical protein
MIPFFSRSGLDGGGYSFMREQVDRPTTLRDCTERRSVAAFAELVPQHGDLPC